MAKRCTDTIVVWLMCRPQEVLKWIREAEIHDAEAYVLEHKFGDYPAALRICLGHVDR